MPKIKIKTKEYYDFIDITDEVAGIVKKSVVKDGVVVVFVAGSTAAITTMEYESGFINDIKETLEKLAPENADYKHHQRWDDRNGAAHIKSALIGADVAVPIEKGELSLGTWQKIVLIDFDEKPREREILISLLKG